MPVEKPKLTIAELEMLSLILVVEKLETVKNEPQMYSCDNKLLKYKKTETK